MAFTDNINASKPTILLVDDEAHFLTSNQTMLSRLGFNVIAVDDMADLRDVFAAHAIKAVVTDFNMPVYNGDEVVAQCREITGNPEFPAFVLSGNPEEARAALAGRGISDVEVFPKTMRLPNELVSALKTELSKGADDLPPH